MKRSPRNNGLIARLFGTIWRRPPSDFGPRRGPQNHVIILDGTMSCLEAGHETNAGLAYKLIREIGPQVSVYYEPGLQWLDWRSARDITTGRGINRQIRRAYGYLASRYRPGDKIFLLGYSRGAFAVRSLAGVIDMVGLLKPEFATERHIRDGYRHYECNPKGEAARAFSRSYCHSKDVAQVEMIGVWDTVKSLGLNMPVFWRLSEARHSFHTHQIGAHIKNGFHALAIDETRVAYSPVMWESYDGYPGRLEQVWFPGTHGDVGGHLGGFLDARPLSNIPLNWMLARAQECGLPLPNGWQTRFPEDVTAPSVGLWRGIGKFLITRRKRVVGSDPSERIHESVAARRAALPRRRLGGWFRAAETSS